MTGKIKIVTNGTTAKVLVNDEELSGVTSVSFDMYAGNPPNVHLTLFGDVEIDSNQAEVIMEPVATLDA